MSAGVIDPRGGQAAEPLAPAPRPGTLEGRRLLLVDNGKLLPVYGNYAVLWDVVRERFPAARISVHAQDLLALPDAEVEELAERLAAGHRPEAALFALADVGVSLPTTLLALAFERRGIPTVILATAVGARFIRGVFDALAPALEVIPLETVRTDSKERVAELGRSVLGDIERCLTSRPAGAVAAARTFAPPAPQHATWPQIADAMHAFQDWAERNDLGDGLPLIPPTERAVAALLARVPDDPDDVIFGPTLASGRLLRVRDAAANAAMTSCPPQAFPVVIAALRAMAKPGYRLNQAAITTHPAGNAVVLSSRDPGRYGLSGGPGCLGPGYRGNAAAGRAVSLTVLSVFGARPGATDLTTFGSPAEFTYCFAESTDASPWPPLANDFGGEDIVLTLKVEGPRNILEHVAMHPQGLCEALAASATNLGANNAYVPGDLLVLLNPEHAGIFAEAGWSRSDVAQAVHDLARNPRARLEGKGLVPIRPAYMQALESFPATRTASDVHVVVAGSAGPQSMVALPWGYSRGQWHPVRGKK